MENQIVDLVIAVDGSAAIFGLVLLLAEERENLFDVRNLSDGLVGLYVACLGLGFGDGRPGLDLAVVETGWLAVVLEPDVFGDDAVEFG